jgi:hypothetical protein
MINVVDGLKEVIQDQFLHLMGVK